MFKWIGFLMVTVICGVVVRKTVMDWSIGDRAAQVECEAVGGTWDAKQLFCKR